MCEIKPKPLVTLSLAFVLSDWLYIYGETRYGEWYMLWRTPVHVVALEDNQVTTC